MTLAVRMFSKVEAQRLTLDIQSAAKSARRGLDNLATLVEEAHSGNVWQMLGYASWTAYLAETLGENPLKLERLERQNVVTMLSDQGLSARAIAPIVGVDFSTVTRDIARVANATPAHQVFERERPPLASVWIDPADGTVITAEIVYDEPTARVTGLDGKSYPQAAPRPAPAAPSHEDADQKNAERGAQDFAAAVFTMAQTDVTEYRERLVGDWWPRGKDAVSPADRDRVTAKTLRLIAAGITQLAREWEI
ncbi:helix-turn-helix domain-containing protein [Subtercola vilae]|uniref:Uncharacterized protein n=1 Tax=Subtercola vilae TaxID=2056433 RepID=A0A4T2BVL1_9MICO|nr:helix-turn-helix domain-containing protein [Subtercola vilae]TIH33826.1 hypothetical protein D4765_13695 [Subtercola vilae]